MSGKPNIHRFPSRYTRLDHFRGVTKMIPHRTAQPIS
jgi:hypothetical protein